MNGNATVPVTPESVLAEQRQRDSFAAVCRAELGCLQKEVQQLAQAERTYRDLAQQARRQRREAEARMCGLQQYLEPHVTDDDGDEIPF
jgi:hypothetical protein